MRQNTVMAHEIVMLPALTFAGFSSQGAGQGIPATWQRLAARRADWPSTALYGVGRPDMHHLYFLAGVLVPDGAAAAEGMEVVAVPAGRYLQQHYSGSRRGLPTVVGALFEQTITGAGEQPATPWTFVVQYRGDPSDTSQSQIDCELYVQLA